MPSSIRLATFARSSIERKAVPRLAANLSMLFTDRPFADRFAAARDAGFQLVEYQFPYPFGTAEEIAARARAAGVEVVLHNLPAGDRSKGEQGLACLPGKIDAFRAGVGKAIEYALAAGCPRLNCLVGIADPEGRGAAWATAIDNIRFAADRLGEAGLTLLLEAISPFAAPGFLIGSSAAGLELIDAVARPNVLLQYDIYHMHMAEGGVAETIARLLPRIGHMQLADVPGRHEPGTGEIDFAALLPEIDRIGYRGAIGCEYLPMGDTRAGLGWARPWLDG